MNILFQTSNKTFPLETVHFEKRKKSFKIERLRFFRTLTLKTLLFRMVFFCNWSKTTILLWSHNKAPRTQNFCIMCETLKMAKQPESKMCCTFPQFLWFSMQKERGRTIFRYGGQLSSMENLLYSYSMNSYFKAMLNGRPAAARHLESWWK